MLTTLMYRTAAVTMTVYMTNRVGVWGKTEETDQLLHQVAKGLHPLAGLLRRVLHFEESDLSVGELSRKYYNEGVKGTFRIIRNIPNYSEDLADGAKVTCRDLVEKAKELRQQEYATWWHSSTNNEKPKIESADSADSAAGVGSSEDLIPFPKPKSVDNFVYDVLAPRTK
ncbi:MICOS complex subunit MIC13 homolog QIL1 [Drosophila teissieri]|uniref:MICOS complex subunit MIC13 homolog QIL1 n=1 Tax=Drosophila teissieri TaxID=7243 RepID=UPI001CBA3B4C|nr:MICOS complex subunit MIC13 homolog QIL1 [Drosophila teissieri]